MGSLKQLKMEQTPIKYHKMLLSYITSLHMWAEVSRIHFLLCVCRLRRLLVNHCPRALQPNKWPEATGQHLHHQADEPVASLTDAAHAPTHANTPSSLRSLSQTAGIGVKFSGNHRTSTCFSTKVSTWLYHTIYLENRYIKLPRIQDSEEIQL